MSEMLLLLGVKLSWVDGLETGLLGCEEDARARERDI